MLTAALDRFGNEESAKLYGWSKIQVGHPTIRLLRRNLRA
jgi:hypothetical protein